MEEIIIVIIQFIVELVVNVISCLPIDWPSRNRTTPEPQGIIIPCIIWFFIGCCLAGLSLLVFKNTIISVSWLRILNIVIAPIASALLSQAISKRRSLTNEFIVPRYHFWRAYWFTLGLVLIRFAYTSHA